MYNAMEDIPILEPDYLDKIQVFRSNETKTRIFTVIFIFCQWKDSFFTNLIYACI